MANFWQKHTSETMPGLYSLATMSPEEFKAFLFSAPTENYMLAKTEATDNVANKERPIVDRKTRNRLDEQKRKDLKNGNKRPTEKIQNKALDMALIAQASVRMMALFAFPGTEFEHPLKAPKDCASGVEVSLNTLAELEKLAPEAYPKTLTEKAEYLTVPGEAFFRLQTQLIRAFPKAVKLVSKIMYPTFNPAIMTMPKNYTKTLLARNPEEIEIYKNLLLVEDTAKKQATEEKREKRLKEREETNWAEEAASDPYEFAPLLPHPDDLAKKSFFMTRNFKKAAAAFQILELTLRRLDDPKRGMFLPDLSEYGCSYTLSGPYRKLLHLCFSHSDDVLALTSEEKREDILRAKEALDSCLDEAEPLCPRTTDDLRRFAERDIENSKTMTSLRDELRAEAQKDWVAALTWRPKDFLYALRNPNDPQNAFTDPRIIRLGKAVQIHGIASALTKSDEAAGRLNIDPLYSYGHLFADQKNEIHQYAFESLSTLIYDRTLLHPEEKQDCFDMTKAALAASLIEVERAGLWPETTASIRKTFGLEANAPTAEVDDSNKTSSHERRNPAQGVVVRLHPIP